MFLRKIIILPVFVFGLIAVLNLLSGDVFNFFLWLFVALIFFFVSYPIATDMDDRQAPVFHIITVMLLIALFFAMATFFDFRQAGISLLESFLYGIVFGITFITFVMLLKGKK
ncbi:MAG: hypothetical protein U9O20_00760 [Patescibacteria group bacterium]|nr:hypothetical protein [Patescibacteria group bacterium]